VDDRTFDPARPVQAPVGRSKPAGRTDMGTDTMSDLNMGTDTVSGIPTRNVQRATFNSQLSTE